MKPITQVTHGTKIFTLRKPLNIKDKNNKIQTTVLGATFTDDTIDKLVNKVAQHIRDEYYHNMVIKEDDPKPFKRLVSCVGNLEVKSASIADLEQIMRGDK